MTPRRERPLRGIALCTLATVCFSTSDTMSKYLTGSLPPVEIAWVRYIVFTLLAASPLVRRRRTSLRSRAPLAQGLRGIGVVGSAVLFIFALGHLPIATATTISFCSPLLTTILSIAFLHERVSPDRWLALLAGFAGVLVVVRPFGGGFDPAALLVLASSTAWSIAMIITRRLSATERPTVTLLWTSSSGLVVLTALLPLSFVRPSLASVGLMLAVGVAASAGQWLTILGFREAPASVLAPFSYTQLIWSIGYGALVFGAIPDAFTGVGGTIIVASGLYNVQAERRRLRLQLAAQKLRDSQPDPAPAETERP